MVSWKRSKHAAVVAGEEEACERLVPAGGGGENKAAAAAVPRGCVALLLVGDGICGGERVVVEVSVLGRPWVGALLEKAAREFGYDQKGVLRVPATADEFRRAVAADAAGAPCRR